MKKYISLLLATAATIACTKVALEDNCPIESLPQDGNTENVQGEPSGEKIIISLAETKVSLDENGFYQFDGGEEIYVKAASTGAVATLRNSESDKNVFTGEFNNVLGKDSETFDFYFNCTEDTKVQNGQPWLSAKGIQGNRAAASDYSYKLDGVQLKQLDGYVCLALNSSYPCSVDFHTLGKALPTGETTISGIRFASKNNKPYFVNIASGMTGGFYLTVTNTEGQKMYTSYGTSATITKNQIINTKAPFAAFSGVSNLKITGFETTYSYYDANNPTEANNHEYYWMNGGTVEFDLSGISSSLVNVTFNNGDSVETGTLEKSGSSFKYTFGSTENHTAVGEKTLYATVSYKDGIEASETFYDSYKRYITGLPYTIQPTKSEWDKTSLYVSFKTNYVDMEGDWATTPDITSTRTFYLPKDINICSNFDYEIISGHYLGDRLITIKMYISRVKVLEYQSTELKAVTKNANVSGIFKSSNSKIVFESKSNKTHTDGITLHVPAVPLNYDKKE